MDKNKKSNSNKLLAALLIGSIAVLVGGIILLFKIVSTENIQESTDDPKAVETTIPEETEAPSPEPTKAEPEPEPTEPEPTEIETIPEISAEPFTRGDRVVQRGTRVVAQTDGALVYYENGQEKWRISGKFGSDILLTDEAVYYVSGEDVQNICYSKLSDGKAMILGGEIPRAQLIGIIDNKLYSFISQPESNEDGKLVMERNLTNGAVRELPFEDMWGDVGSVICQGKLYYTGGRTDVSVTAFYEANLETGESAVLDESAGSGVYTRDGRLYYIHSDSPDGSFVTGGLTVREVDPETSETSDLISGTWEELGAFRDLTANHLVFSADLEGKSRIKLWNRKSRSWENIPEPDEDNLEWINESAGKYYFCGSEIQTGNTDGKYYVYEYDPETGAMGKKTQVTGYPNHVAGEYIYHSKSDSEWNVYTRTPCSIV